VARLLRNEPLLIDLGPDTTIYTNDTLILNAPQGHVSYTWSTGATSENIQVLGKELGAGTFPIWVKVDDYGCAFSDTIIIKVESGFGINELENGAVRIYPNPFKDEIIIEDISTFKSVRIYDLQGANVAHFDPKEIQPSGTAINLAHLKRGIYFLELIGKDKTFAKKIIKM
jgi:Secretion system C-terminal sorting domain